MHLKYTPQHDEIVGPPLKTRRPIVLSYRKSCWNLIKKVSAALCSGFKSAESTIEATPKAKTYAKAVAPIHTQSRTKAAWPMIPPAKMDV